jgi:hypothetical protein
MIPVGYMAKRMPQSGAWLKAMKVPLTLEVYSVGNCVNDDFADYVNYWKHNGWWFFDSPAAIQAISLEHSISLDGTLLFFYEVYEFEFHDGRWRTFLPDRWVASGDIVMPTERQLEGYDVVTFWPENSPAPEHSPLSCNAIANRVKTNSHCLIETFEQAQSAVNAGQFTGCEPGALRIIAVFSVVWPSLSPVAGG